MKTVSNKLIVFDLDGTLVDSLPVLEFGINQMRRDRGLSSLAPRDIAAMSGGPMHGFLRRVVAVDGSALDSMAKDSSWVLITHRVPADFRFDGMVTLEDGKMVS